MAETTETLKSLGLGLSRLLRYSYGGFLVIAFAAILEPGVVKSAREAMSWELAALTAVVLGAGIYAVHRSVVVPVHHALMCLFWWGADAYSRIDKKESSNPTRWLGSLGVPLGYRIPAYTALRRNKLFKEEQTDWDIAHAETGLVLITTEAFSVAAVYAARHPTPPVGWLPLACIAGGLFVFSFAGFVQHAVERRRFYEKKQEVKNALQELGMLRTGRCCSST
jgi:hypothetical protein